jgi:hypothetical protein
MNRVQMFFRNDDPDTFEFGDKRQELRKLVELFIGLKVPLTHAVVPKTVTPETVEYLRGQKRAHPELVEIVQHGFQHHNYGRGEFDDTRNHEQQTADIQEGRRLLREKFDVDVFFPAFVFPHGGYTRVSLQVLDELGFKVLSCYWKFGLKHRIAYSLCRPLGIGPVGKYHISYHGRRFARFGFYECSNCINVIRSMSPPLYFSAEVLFSKLLRARKHDRTIGCVLHYNTLDQSEAGEANFLKLREFVQRVREADWIECVTLEKAYRRMSNGSR